ncbi:2-aminoethanethiol dioxygenase-like [Corythoichthys intestinalis]|uniref:2-aminoethanethiol dioxygenase-like n=1 Tax=Corythoichthys intestinalis TaxID=161448 RepID=UPI0025A6084C|nr:2-aminoethanethiol dioxygenase-like [Corythoichthys intestinalis]XP_061794700.1 2-aminoethanethiol dioxygenase-like [Nerophis lumbriciformis]
MKPRESSTMSSLVQMIARQALVTFRQPPRSFADNHKQLLGLISQVRSADLRVLPPVSPPPRGAPPVTYMHICETEQFSMGVFLLKSGARIPLHDHPGMHGVLKVLYGKLRVSCFDRLDAGPEAGEERPRLGALRRSVLRSSAEYTDASEPCVLAPDRDNLHQIDAVDGPAAFVDVLAPPYDPDDGRDCHYFRVLQGPEVREPHDREVLLMEIAQPVSFWCGTEPYLGPGVRL